MVNIFNNNENKRLKNIKSKPDLIENKINIAQNFKKNIIKNIINNNHLSWIK